MNGQPLFRLKLNENKGGQEVLTRSTVVSSQRSKLVYSEGASNENKQAHMLSSQNSTAQLQQHDTEHMVTLHARLHMEADKIRKWKIHTELELKDKVKRLAEANVQLDTMKKSLLELQLENERISVRLQEEMGNREEVLRRINGTREMCNLLQTHAAKVEDRVVKCETERTELKYVSKENMQLIEEVTKQLQQLRLVSSESKKKLQNQKSAERNNRLQMEKTMQAKLDAVEKEVQRLHEMIRDKDDQLSEHLKTIHKQEQNVTTLEKTKEDLQKKLSSLFEEMVIKEQELKDSSLRISSVQDEKCRLEKLWKTLDQDLHSLQASKDSLVLDMTEANQTLEAQLQAARQEVQAVRQLLQQEHLRLQKCQDQLEESSAHVDSIKASKDSLQIEKADLEIQLDLQKFQVSNLQTEKAEDKEEIQRLNEEMTAMSKKMDNQSVARVQAQNEVETLQHRVTTLLLQKDEFQREISGLKEQLATHQEKSQTLETLLSEEEAKVMKLQRDIDNLKREIAVEREHNQEAEELMDEFKQENQNKDTDLEMKDEVIGKLRADLQNVKSDNSDKESQLKAANSELERLRCQLSEQENKIQNLSYQLEESMEQQKELDKSLTLNQRKIYSSVELKNGLEKEVTSLKINLEQEKKAARQQETELAHLRFELEEVKQTNKTLEHLMRQKNEEVSRMQELCQQEQEASRLSIKKAEEMRESALKEKQNAMAVTDCQLAEMMATLENYKQNNEKLIAEKAAENQLLKSKMEATESMASRKDKNLFESMREVEQLKSQLASVAKDKETELIKNKKEMEYLKEQITVLTREKSFRSPEPKKQVVMENPTPRMPPPKMSAAPLTPKMSVPLTPIKTPQSSILKANNCLSISKRRKVVFGPTVNTNPYSSSEESDLMELNTDSAELVEISTPMLTKFSPKFGNISNSFTVNVTPQRTPVSNISAIARNQQTSASAAEVLKSRSVRGSSLETHRSSHLEALNSTMNTKVSNLRKTPAKKTSKIFTISPRNKMLNPKSVDREKTKADMSWFELDSVYGFNPSD